MRTIKTEYFDILSEYIRENQRENGYSPTILEMERDLGIPKSTVARYLKLMDERGMIDIKGPGRIVAKNRDKDLLSLPVLGAISCGVPKFAEENIEEYVQVPAAWFGGGELFALRANGDSMINAGIDDGDLVIIKNQSYADANQIIVALIDNEDATLKRYRPQEDRRYIDLVPENEKYSTRTVDLAQESLVIQGVALKVIKDLE